MSEMKLCPFCGKSDIHIEQKGTFFWCECYDCGAISREHHALPGVNILQSEDFARRYWNQRPLEDALHARTAELEAARRWIPVSERLPEEDTDGNTLMAICRHSGEWVRAPFGAEFADEFVRHYSYWMYAPQPPEVQE